MIGDLALCPECETPVTTGARVHAACCDHDEAEDVERLYGIAVGTCVACRATVQDEGELDEDGIYRPVWQRP